MKRFIQPNELARDRRFKRAKAGNQLVTSLPNDAEKIADVLELVGPKIRERIAGTALESVYDELGPGFSFQNGTPSWLLEGSWSSRWVPPRRNGARPRGLGLPPRPLWTSPVARLPPASPTGRHSLWSPFRRPFPRTR